MVPDLFNSTCIQLYLGQPNFDFISFYYYLQQCDWLGIGFTTYKHLIVTEYKEQPVGQDPRIIILDEIHNNYFRGKT